MPADMLRFATAGSVDDGKSTLIGRLLFDSKALFSDQLAAVERVSRDRGHDYTDLALITDGLARRARAGDHDRRRLPLLRDAAPQVHHRRHPRPHPVHAEHGHRRLDRRRGARPARRPARDHRAEPAARLHRRRSSASPTSSCASTRWTSSTGRRRCSRASAPSSASSPRGCASATCRSSRSPRCSATTS